MIGDAEHIFPAEDGLFEETFSTDNTYRVHGLNITIHQDYSANLGVAASVWDSGSYLLNSSVKNNVSAIVLELVSAQISCRGSHRQWKAAYASFHSCRWVRPSVLLGSLVLYLQSGTVLSHRCPSRPLTITSALDETKVDLSLWDKKSSGHRMDWIAVFCRLHVGSAFKIAVWTY
ncbi:hypothetical protein QQF64_007630 [Cirrhinus molitorella]|uniref:Uncharacterized protein n=1 Tax=Cirrhinus molitorella TaxID=172907 RepID=A0ABR3MBU6_9TELE